MDLFLVFPAIFETRSKALNSYSFIKLSRNEDLGHLLVNLSSGYHANNDRYESFDFSFGYVFPSSMKVHNFITIKWQEKKLSIINIFKLFVSDHLNKRLKVILVQRKLLILFSFSYSLQQ